MTVFSWDACIFNCLPFVCMPGSAKDWCLMCELEHHIMMLRENGGPLSISRILGHMRSMNCQMVDGSQEDAHEFLRSFEIPWPICFLLFSKDTGFVPPCIFFLCKSPIYSICCYNSLSIYKQKWIHCLCRLLVASMQSICLEGVGGEKNVNPRLQETTFVQHTFGGRLLSKVSTLVFFLSPTLSFFLAPLSAPLIF